ncbi:retrovirus-related pol polyprotein from transposon TNT 1-94 [Tanacetum coccineum]
MKELVMTKIKQSINDSFKDFVPMESEKESGWEILTEKICTKTHKEEESYNYRSSTNQRSLRVHTLEIEDGTMIHMLAERRYPLSRELMIRMLEHGMEVENESETAITLIHLFILWTTANGMYRIATTTTQNREPQLPHASRNTNPHVSKSSGVNHTTSVSRPQLKCYQVKDKVVPNNSQVKFKKKEVEDHHRISSISKKTKSVTACNDSSKSRTLNVNVVCAECGKCVFNSNHDACVSRYLNDVNARTKKPKVVPISASKPKRKANKSVATPHKKTVASDTTIQKSKSYYKELYENTNQEWKWWIAKKCPSDINGHKIHIGQKRYGCLKSGKRMYQQIVQLILFIVDSGCTKHMTGNLKLLCNFVEKFLGTVRFENHPFAPILGYGDLNQGNITIKWVYYVEGLNHNLFSVGQFCDADLEVAFRKSTCFVRDLQGNDLLTGNHGSDLYTISLQETTSSTPICFMAKASPTQAWLWHRRLSHLNFDYITLLSKKDIVTGLPKLTYVKDQLCSSCEMSKAKRSSFKSKAVPSSKGRLNLLHMDLCGPMRVASINGKKYILVIVDDYSRYTWTLFLRSKDETPEVLKLSHEIQRNLQAQVIIPFLTEAQVS